MQVTNTRYRRIVGKTKDMPERINTITSSKSELIIDFDNDKHYQIDIHEGMTNQKIGQDLISIGLKMHRGVI